VSKKSVSWHKTLKKPEKGQETVLARSACSSLVVSVPSMCVEFHIFESSGGGHVVSIIIFVKALGKRIVVAHGPC
jgi:hypothetical protein